MTARRIINTLRRAFDFEFLVDQPTRGRVEQQADDDQDESLLRSLHEIVEIELIRFADFVDYNAGFHPDRIGILCLAKSITQTAGTQGPCFQVSCIREASGYRREKLLDKNNCYSRRRLVLKNCTASFQCFVR